MPIPRLALLEGCPDYAGGFVARIREDQRETATPCPEFTVGDQFVAFLGRQPGTNTTPR